MALRHVSLQDLAELADKDLEDLGKMAGLNMVNRRRLINAVQELSKVGLCAITSACVRAHRRCMQCDLSHHHHIPTEVLYHCNTHTRTDTHVGCLQPPAPAASSSVGVTPTASGPKANTQNTTVRLHCRNNHARDLVNDPNLGIELQFLEIRNQYLCVPRLFAANPNLIRTRHTHAHTCECTDQHCYDLFCV